MTQVRQMTGRTGAPVANQFIITDGEFEFFQSYKTVIAKRHISAGVVTLDADRWDYSCLLYTSPSPRDAHESRMPSSA